MFRYKRSVKVSYDRQGYIYFYSRLYKNLDAAGREYIEETAKAAGGVHAEAVLKFVTTDDGEAKVCREHNLSRATLYRVVGKYYELF